MFKTKQPRPQGGEKRLADEEETKEEKSSIPPQAKMYLPLVKLDTIQFGV